VPWAASVGEVSADDAAPFADVSRSLLRRTLLEAARDLAADRPWKAVTMAAIAARAGVSRQTVYNEFGSRPSLTQALVVHELEEFLAAVEGAIRERADDPAAAVAAAVDVFLRAASEDPLVAAVAGEDGRDELLPLVTSRGEPLLRLGRERLATIIGETWPTVAREESEFLAETIMRLGLSYVVLPIPPDATRVTAEGVARLLRPYLRGLLEATTDA
jgi:AcrR family transcriptional regulator